MTKTNILGILGLISTLLAPLILFISLFYSFVAEGLIVFFVFLTAGLTFSIVALVQIRKTNEKGKRIAITGVIAFFILILFFLLAYNASFSDPAPQARCLILGDFMCQEAVIWNDGTIETILLVARDSKIYDVKIDSYPSSEAKCNIDSGTPGSVYLSDSTGSSDPDSQAVKTDPNYFLLENSTEVFFKVKTGQRYHLVINCADRFTADDKFYADITLRYSTTNSDIVKTVVGELKNYQVAIKPS